VEYSFVKGKNQFLLEIGVEEMPARFLEPAFKQLKELAEDGLKENRLGYENIEAYGTPRRLVLFIDGLADVQEPLEDEVKGPAQKVAFDVDGRPTKAARGFAASQGVRVSELQIKTVKGVDYVFAVRRQPGRAAEDVLAELCVQWIKGLHFPKPMRWGDLDVRFARPIRWLVALFNNKVVKFRYAKLTSGRRTYSHRFWGGRTFEVGNPAGYFVTMKLNYVIVDPGERREIIRKQVQKLAMQEGGVVKEDRELLAEVANLVEYPTAFCGSFEEHYLSLPQEVLITPMREHQRYFPVFDKNGNLLPKFIGVANSTSEHIDKIRAGNEKVLRARLADAEFFYREDLKEPLTEKVSGLKKIIFQEELGTVYEKMERIRSLATELAGVLGMGDRVREQVKNAAFLAKADLVTNMVYEFPELQGIMGREYALRAGVEPAVCEAIFEHYQPRFAGDDLPVTAAGRVLSISDKLDNIVGCFGIGKLPTGSQDPYALRRQALGICNIILDAGMHLSFKDMVSRTYAGYGGRLKLGLNEVLSSLEEFFQQRLKSIFTEAGFSYDVIDAVLAVGFDDFTDTMSRAQALADFRENRAFQDVITVYNRANNLAGKVDDTEVDPGAFRDPAESQLYAEFIGVKSEAEKALKEGDYMAALVNFTRLYQPIDRFFNSVMVMDEDPGLRRNRLALLKNITVLVKQVADLSKVVELPQ